MTQKCYCDWTLVWWWFGFGSGSDYVLSILFGSGSDLDTSEIFRIGSDYQILISAQHCPSPPISVILGLDGQR